jgi:hypothetical protein
MNKKNKMKITYKQNPLATTIELDEREKKELWNKIKIKELEEILVGASMYLREDDKWFDLQKARDEIDLSYIFSDELDENGKNIRSKIDKCCDEMLGYYIEALMETHSGDCTCFPCSCIKCHAEDLLEINTTKGLGKHSSRKILYAFNDKDNHSKGENHWIETPRSIDEVIERLKNYDPKPKPKSNEGWEKFGGWEQYVPRWIQEAKLAHDWLLNYKNEHFNN